MTAHDAVRARSLRVVTALGFPAPPEHFPSIERARLRSKKDVVERALVSNVVINCAFGMPTHRARAWLAREGVLAKLTPGETIFLDDIDAGGDPGSNDVKIQIEALWVLAWALGFEERLDFGRYCGDQLARQLPDLRRDESRARFEAAATLRDRDDVHAALDVACCLTWGVADANLTGTPSPGKVRPYVLWERRRALEWLFGAEWDDPPMDT